MDATNVVDITKTVHVGSRKSQVGWLTTYVSGTGVCKCYIGPIGDLSLLTAAAAAAHSPPDGRKVSKRQAPV